MRKIFKYPLRLVEGSQFVEMPSRARLLTVQAQRGGLCLWAVVDDLPAVLEFRQIRIVGTGEWVPTEIADTGDYLGTVQLPSANLPGGLFVAHVFAVTRSHTDV